MLLLLSTLQKCKCEHSYRLEVNSTVCYGYGSQGVVVQSTAPPVDGEAPPGILQTPPSEGPCEALNHKGLERRLACSQEGDMVKHSCKPSLGRLRQGWQGGGQSEQHSGSVSKGKVGRVCQ